MKHLIFLFLAICLEVVGTSSLKYSEQFTKLLPSLITVITYAVAFYLLSHSLKVLPVGVAYAIWSGMGIVFVSIAGYILFKQSLNPPTIIGMIFIVVGVFIINLFPKTTL